METLYERIESLCKKRGLSLMSLANELGLPYSTLLSWKKSVPAADKLGKAAKYLGVSMEYLLGVTDTASTADAILRDSDMVLLQRARETMSAHDKARMMTLIRVGFESAFEE